MSEKMHKFLTRFKNKKKYLLLLIVSHGLMALAFVLYVSFSGQLEINWLYSNDAEVYFARTETTVEQYKMCIKEGACTDISSKNKKCNINHSERDNHPVNCVNKSDAEAFCKFAGGRLPSEDEWYAEASFSGKHKYTWGDIEPNCDLAVIFDGQNGCGKDNTWPVCSKPLGNSISGLCDMIGNLWEWTSTVDKTTSVVRGGSAFDENHDRLNAAYRFWSTSAAGYRLLGFRCVSDNKL